MKKTIAVVTMLSILLISNIGTNAFAIGSNLIENVEIHLKNAETPKRLEVSFDLSEPINLAQGSANIIFEFFKDDGNGNLEAMSYKKDRSWSGYLNSYDNYPFGEKKYSSGGGSASYSDSVPAARIYTSTRTGASIDVTLVTAVRITVLRPDGSGERAVIYADGAVDTERIEVSLAEEEINTGIRLEATTAELPAGTVLIAGELTGGTVYEMISVVLEDTNRFIVFEITLESNGDEVRPDGYVTLNIPIPDDFDVSGLSVFRIDADGTKTPYPFTVTEKEGVRYVTFETNHFSVYALAESVAEQDDTPKTGTAQATAYYLTAAAVSLLGYLFSRKKNK